MGEDLKYLPQVKSHVPFPIEAMESYVLKKQLYVFLLLVLLFSFI